MRGMSEHEHPSGHPGSEALQAFIAGVRARLVFSALLGAAAFAALVNETVRWSAAAAVVYLGWNVPVLGFIGLLVLLVLVPVTRRRWSIKAAAGMADARLGLRDRLASWVDFSGRDEIPAVIRRVQAAETGRALAGVNPAAVVPIARWRKAGPLLLAACLAYPFFLPRPPSRPSPLIQRIVPRWRFAPTGSDVPAGERAAPPDGAARPPGQREDPGKREASRSADGEKRHGLDARDGSQPAEQADRKQGAAETKFASGNSRPSGDRAHPGRDEAGGAAGEPGRIESERVGSRLARVVDPLYRAGAAVPPAADPLGGRDVSPAAAVRRRGRRRKPGRRGNGTGAGPRRPRCRARPLPPDRQGLFRTPRPHGRAGGRQPRTLTPRGADRDRREYS